MAEKQSDELNFPPFNDDIDKEDRYDEYFRLFREYEVRRNGTIRHFSKDGLDRNIINYVNDSVDRMNERKLKPSYKEDWQSNVFDPITRNKVITILSMMARARMKPELLIKRDSIFNTEDVDLRRSIFNDLLENANDHNNDDEQIIWEMFTGLSEGTVIGYEGWSKGTHDIEFVKDYDVDTGEIKTETVQHDQWDDVFGEIVPIDEFYPETIFVNSKDFYRKVKRVFRAREMFYANYIDVYGGFPGARTVEPASFFFQGDKVKFGITEDTNPKNVFVLEYYDTANDKKGVWANGKELYWGPNPFNHKQLPFWISIAEPVHNQLLYGKSLPDKLMGMQDVDNGILNGMLDQLFQSLNSPIFIDGVIDLDEGYLEPGRIYEMDPGTKIQRASLGQVDQTGFQMLQLIKRSMEETSVSAQAAGVPSGGRKTKFEVQQLQEGALQLAGLFLQLMENAAKRKYYLRTHNIAQYYSLPNRAKTGKKKFKFIELDERPLSNGKTGKRKIQILGSAAEQPAPEEVRRIAVEESGAEDQEDFTVEPIFITRDYLLDNRFSMEIKIVPNSSIKDSETQRRNNAVTFYSGTKGDPLVDQVKIT